MSVELHKGISDSKLLHLFPLPCGHACCVTFGDDLGQLPVIGLFVYSQMGTLSCSIVTLQVKGLRGYLSGLTTPVFLLDPVVLVCMLLGGSV